MGCVSGQTEDHKVLKILRNYAVNRGFCSKEQSLQGKTESFLLGFIKQSEKLPSSKKPDRSAGLEATVDLARHRRSNESQSRYLTSAPDDEIASGSSDDGTVAPVTSNFAKNIVNGFGQFLQFVNDLEEPQVSMKSIEEAKKLLAPLLIWITFDLLENGYKLEAQNLLTTYISQVNEGVKNRKNLEEIEEITQEILEVLEDVTLDGEKLRVAFRRLLKLKLSDSLFVAISAECRDLITAYLRNMRNPMLMLQTFNAFVTVDEAAPMHSGENLLSETEEEEEIEMVGGNSVEMKVTPSAAEKSEELPKSVKKRKRIPTIEPEKKKRGSEDVIPTPSQANIGMKSNLLMQSTFESRVDEKNDMAVAGLDDLDHLPPILPTRVHRFHLSGTNSEGYNRACISANGQIVGVACDNGTLEVWSSQKRK